MKCAFYSIQKDVVFPPPFPIQLGARFAKVVMHNHVRNGPFTKGAPLVSRSGRQRYGTG